MKTRSASAMILILLLMSALVSSSALADGLMQKAQTSFNEDVFKTLESAVFSVDGRSWYVASQQISEREILREYFLKGESPKKWSEMVSNHHYRFAPRKDQDGYLSGRAASYKKDLLSSCPTAVFKMLDQSATSILFESSIKGCSKVQDQSEVLRVMLGEQGFHEVRYTVKASPMPKEKRAEWLKILSAAKLVAPLKHSDSADVPATGDGLLGTWFMVYQSIRPDINASSIFFVDDQVLDFTADGYVRNIATRSADKTKSHDIKMTQVLLATMPKQAAFKWVKPGLLVIKRSKSDFDTIQIKLIKGPASLEGVPKDVPAKDGDMVFQYQDPSGKIYMTRYFRKMNLN